MQTTLKVFIEFVTILLLFYVLDFWPWGRLDLSSLTKDRTHTLCIGRQSPNHILKGIRWRLSFFGLISVFRHFMWLLNELDKPSYFSLKKRNSELRYLSICFCSKQGFFWYWLHYFFVSLFHRTPMTFILVKWREKKGGEEGKMKEGRARGMEARIRFLDFLLKDSESIDLNWIVLWNCVFRHFQNWWWCVTQVENHHLKGYGNKLKEK